VSAGPLVREVLVGERVTLRPLRPEHVDAVVAIIQEPSVALWWPAPGGAAEIRADLNDDECAIWLIEVDGVAAGMIQACEENTPQYRSAGIDIVLGGAFQDRGLGSEALSLLIRFLIDVREHHRITIDPAVENERAVHVYAKAGFRPIGIARAYEQRADGTHRDALLMDLLAGEER